MDRRRFLAAAGGVTSLLAGCSGTTGTPTATPGGTEDLPDAIYVQRFRETMSMQGTAEAGPYRVAFMYAAPHVFWNVNGGDLSKTPRSGDIHGMAVVFHEPTNTVVPETGLSLQIQQDGELVTQEVIYPMLSQRMGFHYGANFPLSGDGEYTAKVSVGAVPDAVALTGDYEGQFRESVDAEIEFAFNEQQREKVQVEELEAYGRKGAVKPMEMGMLPQATAPPTDALPGQVLGEPLSDGARLVTAALDGEAATRFGTDSYLAVSARTRYNGLVLPAMAMAATVSRDGETVYDDTLTRTLDPELGYHYGADVAVQSGDELELRATTPPQVARHEGYERALLDVEPVTVTV